MFRRLAPGLVAMLALSVSPAAATTAQSLSGRIVLDGRLDEYANDEWILDASTAFPERSDDSRWGSDNDVARVAVTWDQARLYLAVDATVQSSSILVMIANGPGGLASLEATGEFRRAIDLPFQANLLVLATPGSIPSVARADAAHVFGLVDRATIPAVVATTAGGETGLEVWIPWTVIDPSRPVQIVVAITADTGSGAGDAAPDARTVLATARYAPAVLDRWITLVADTDGDGIADAGVAPRAVAAVEPDTAPSAAAGSAGIDVTVDPKAFAPDRGESAAMTLRTASGSFDEISGTCLVYAMNGRSVRTISIPLTALAPAIQVVWDGRDNSGRICDGGVYAVAFDVEFVAAGTRQRATKRAGVAVVR